MTSKYVAGERGALQFAVVFPDTRGHDDMRGLFTKITSAGFVSIRAVEVHGESRTYPTVEVALYGKSVSLGVESNSDDLDLVLQALGVNGH